MLVFKNTHTHTHFAPRRPEISKQLCLLIAGRKTCSTQLEREGERVLHYASRDYKAALLTHRWEKQLERERERKTCTTQPDKERGRERDCTSQPNKEKGMERERERLALHNQIEREKEGARPALHSQREIERDMLYTDGEKEREAEKPALHNFSKREGGRETCTTQPERERERGETCTTQRRREREGEKRESLSVSLANL